jgi:hypothetical protein
MNQTGLRQSHRAMVVVAPRLSRRWKPRHSPSLHRRPFELTNRKSVE